MIGNLIQNNKCCSLSCKWHFLVNLIFSHTMYKNILVKVIHISLVILFPGIQFRAKRNCGMFTFTTRHKINGDSRFQILLFEEHFKVTFCLHEILSVSSEFVNGAHSSNEIVRRECNFKNSLRNKFWTHIIYLYQPKTMFTRGTHTSFKNIYIFLLDLTYILNKVTLVQARIIIWMANILTTTINNLNITELWKIQ